MPRLAAPTGSSRSASHEAAEPAAQHRVQHGDDGDAARPGRCSSSRRGSASASRTCMPWSPRVNSCELPITTRAISANASVVSARYGPLSFSTSLPSTQPSSAVLDDRGRDAERQRHLPVVVEQRRRVGADHREGRRRERELPRVAGEQVPGERDDREIDADEDDAERVRAGDEERHQREGGAITTSAPRRSKRRRSRPEVCARPLIRSRPFSPSRPCGRNSRTSMRMIRPNASR